MKIHNVKQLNDFLAALNECKGQVWLESPEGDKFNLKSEFSQYLALGALLGERGDFLELYCTHREDESHFFKYFGEHPEVQE